MSCPGVLLGFFSCLNVINVHKYQSLIFNVHHIRAYIFVVSRNKFFSMYIMILVSIASITRNNSKLLEKDRIEFRLNVELRNIARLAQSVEHETLNLRVVGSSPTLGDIVL